jgi:hypothetical protein
LIRHVLILPIIFTASFILWPKASPPDPSEPPLRVDNSLSVSELYVYPPFNRFSLTSAIFSTNTITEPARVELSQSFDAARLFILGTGASNGSFDTTETGLVRWIGTVAWDHPVTVQINFQARADAIPGLLYFPAHVQDIDGNTDNAADVIRLCCTESPPPLNPSKIYLALMRKSGVMTPTPTRAPIPTSTPTPSKHKWYLPIIRR